MDSTLSSSRPLESPSETKKLDSRDADKLLVDIRSDVCLNDECKDNTERCSSKPLETPSKTTEVDSRDVVYIRSDISLSVDCKDKTERTSSTSQSSTTSSSGSEDDELYPLSERRSPDSPPLPPLFLAIESGDVSQVLQLVQEGHDVNKKYMGIDLSGWSLSITPLHAAILTNNREMVSLLLQKGAERDVEDYWGWRPLHIAVKTQNTEIVALLLQSGADTADLDATDYRGPSPLQRAVLTQNAEIVALLLQNGADIEATDNNGWRPLHRAVETHNTDMVALLLQNGADIEGKDGRGKSPLHLAVDRQNTEIMALLLQSGANREITDQWGDKQLHRAVETQNSEILALLLQNGADIEGKDGRGLSPLHRAVDTQNPEMVALLLQNGADIEATDYRGRTPLHNAMNGPVKIVNILLEYKGDINSKDLDGRVPLHFAIDGPVEIVNVLLEYKADINAKDKKGKTPLMLSRGRDTRKVLLNSLENLFWALEILQKETEKRKIMIDDFLDVYAEAPTIKRTSVLDWGQRSLNDETLKSHLEDLTNEIEYKVLFVNSNSIKSLPDFSLIHPFKSLEYLDCSNNLITTMHGLPPTLKIFQLYNNPIEILGEHCFHSETYQPLKVSITRNGLLPILKQPPEEVFVKGISFVQQYFKDGDLIFNSRYRLVHMGETGSGKSSLMESIILGEPFLTDAPDRTQVLQIKTWRITNSDVFHIYDQGGHFIYNIVNPFFVTRKSIVLICQKLGVSDDYVKKTIQLFRSTLHQHPGIRVYFVLTHIDCLRKDQIEVEYQKFQNEINSLLQKEVDTLDRLVSSSTNEEHPDIENLKVVFQNCKNKVKDIQYFLVSNKTYQGIETLKEFLVKTIEKDRVAIPLTWINCVKQINKMKSTFFLEMKQLTEVFTIITPQQPTTDVSDSIHACLQYLNDTGFIFWRQENEKLQNIVFHNLDFLIGLFKSLLHHDLAGSLDYENNRDIQMVYKEEEELNRALQQYHHEGLLQHKLLSFLWKKYDLTQQNEMTLLSLIKIFHICHEVISYPEDISLQVYFVPWLVRNNAIPDELDIENPMIFNRDTASLSMKCIFWNQIPMNVSESYFVAIQEYAVEKSYLGHRYAWADGLQITIGSTDIFAFRDVSKSALCLCIRGQPLEEEILAEMWHSFDELFKLLQEVLKPLNGSVRSLFSPCNHCSLKSIEPPHKWLRIEVFPLHPNKIHTVRCKKDHRSIIPVALVSAHPDDFIDDKIRRKRMDAVIDYIRKEIQPTGYIGVESRSLIKEGSNDGTLDTLHKDAVTVERQMQQISIKGLSTLADNKLTQDQNNYIWEKLAPSVCQITHGMKATGFVVGSLPDTITNLPHRYVLTCYHLKLQDAFNNSQQCTAEFGFNQIYSPPAVSVNIIPTVIACDCELDYILVRLEHSHALEGYLRNAQPLVPLIAKTTPGHHDPLILIGHPDGYEKKLDPSVCSISSQYISTLPEIKEAIARGIATNVHHLQDDNCLFYHCHSFHGASGSPCLSVQQNLLYSMHCNGVYIGHNVAGSFKSYVEYGVSLWSVLKDIKAKVQRQYFSSQEPMLKIPNELYGLFPQLQ